MIQEYKQLLLKELCARLPYGVKVTWDGKYPLTVTPHIYCAIASENKIDNLPKLLLRSMSSMTEEETEIFNSDFGGIENGYNSIEIKRIDWLNANHFDYRGLIEKDLAFEAPNDMYKI